jgi:CRISPR-associated endonuclease/helicase Cas3
MKLYSHPGKFLIEHLSEVSNNCKCFIDERVLFVSNPGKKQVLHDLVYLAGAFHDIGKGTSFFQHYLLSEGHEVKGPKNHALISALFVKEISKEYLDQTPLSNFEKNLFAHLAFTSVKRHHGRLGNFEGELYIELKSDELQQQIVAFDEVETEAIITHFSSVLNLQYSFKDFKNYILSKEYLEDMPEFYFSFSEDDDFNKLPLWDKIEHYYFHQLLFSVLLLSDKTDVILDRTMSNERVSVSYDKVELFRQRKGFDIPINELDERKNEAFLSALKNLSKVNIFIQ